MSLNLSSKLSSFFTTATPQETAPVEAARLPAAPFAAAAPVNTVDAFDAGTAISFAWNG